MWHGFRQASMAIWPATTDVRGPVLQWTMRLTKNQKIAGTVNTLTVWVTNCMDTLNTLTVPIQYTFYPPLQRKFIDWKKTKLFRFRWNWAEDQKFRGIRLQISSPPPLQPVAYLFIADNDAPSLLRKEWSGFCRYYYCSENAFKRIVSRDSLSSFFIQFYEVISVHSYVHWCFALKGECHDIFSMNHLPPSPWK